MKVLSVALFVVLMSTISCKTASHKSSVESHGGSAAARAQESWDGSTVKVNDIWSYQKLMIDNRPTIRVFENNDARREFMATKVTPVGSWTSASDTCQSLDQSGRWRLPLLTEFMFVSMLGVEMNRVLLDQRATGPAYVYPMWIAGRDEGETSKYRSTNSAIVMFDGRGMDVELAAQWAQSGSDGQTNFTTARDIIGGNQFALWCVMGSIE